MLLASSGFTLYQHYCHGYLISSSLVHPPPSCCGDECDCCSNNQVTFQLDDDYVDVVFQFNWFDFEFESPELIAFDQEMPTENFIPEVITTSPSPPDTPGTLALLQVYSL